MLREELDMVSAACALAKRRILVRLRAQIHGFFLQRSSKHEAWRHRLAHWRPLAPVMRD